jgi:hypothetical protein
MFGDILFCIEGRQHTYTHIACAYRYRYWYLNTMSYHHLNRRYTVTRSPLDDAVSNLTQQKHTQTADANRTSIPYRLCTWMDTHVNPSDSELSASSLSSEPNSGVHCLDSLCGSRGTLTRLDGWMDAPPNLTRNLMENQENGIIPVSMAVTVTVTRISYIYISAHYTTRHDVAITGHQHQPGSRRDQTSLVPLPFVRPHSAQLQPYVRPCSPTPDS